MIVFNATSYVILGVKMSCIRMNKTLCAVLAAITLVLCSPAPLVSASSAAAKGAEGMGICGITNKYGLNVTRGKNGKKILEVAYSLGNENGPDGAGDQKGSGSGSGAGSGSGSGYGLILGAYKVSAD